MTNSLAKMLSPVPLSILNPRRHDLNKTIQLSVPLTVSWQTVKATLVFEQLSVVTSRGYPMPMLHKTWPGDWLFITRTAYCHNLLSPVEAHGHLVLDLLLRAGEGRGLGAAPWHYLAREVETWKQKKLGSDHLYFCVGTSTCLPSKYLQNILR